jgi:hypothetical protein
LFRHYFKSKKSFLISFKSRNILAAIMDEGVEKYQDALVICVSATIEDDHAVDAQEHFLSLVSSNTKGWDEYLSTKSAEDRKLIDSYVTKWKEALKKTDALEEAHAREEIHVYMEDNPAKPPPTEEDVEDTKPPLQNTEPSLAEQERYHLQLQTCLQTLTDFSNQVTINVKKHRKDIARTWDRIPEDNHWGYVYPLPHWSQAQLLGASNPERAVKLLLKMRPYDRWKCLVSMIEQERKKVVQGFDEETKRKILDHIDQIQRVEGEVDIAGTFLWTPAFRWGEVQCCAGCKKQYEPWDGFSLCEFERKSFHTGMCADHEEK